MFGEILGRVLNETPGAVAVTLMGFDGIEVDTQQNIDAMFQISTDVGAAAIELGNITSQLKRVAEGMGAGDIEELTVRTGVLTTVLRPLTDEYFVAVSLAPEGNTGKGRYLLRVVAPKLTAELT